MAKINWVGRMLFRITVLGLLGYSVYAQAQFGQWNFGQHFILDANNQSTHNEIYGECKKPTL
jgi:hypothetical protein